jgi:hypothetical protein
VYAELDKDRLILEVMSHMSTFRAKVDVQTNSIWIIAGLISCSTKHKDYMFNVGALQDVLVAMETHR